MKILSICIGLCSLFIASNSFTQEQGRFTDARDGKTYKTIKIGSQVWMAENLAFKADNGIWSYENPSGSIFGYLYTWDAAIHSCPVGWHLPADADWTCLVKFLGTNTIAGGKLK
jgi:uncharacterized protein (TIGR02145 family)